MANPAKSAMCKASIQWECTYEAIMVHGYKPVQVNAIVDEEGNTSTNHNDVCSRWQHISLMF